MQRRRLREQRRRVYFRRRMIALAIVLSFIAGIAAGAVLLSHRGSGSPGERVSALVHHHRSGMLRQPRPAEVRGVHVTMALASLPAGLDRYFALRGHGLNTIELDVKDESGQVALQQGADLRMTQGIGTDVDVQQDVSGHLGAFGDRGPKARRPHPTQASGTNINLRS